MVFKLGIIFFLSLIYLNGNEAIKCYASSSSPTSPYRLSEIQCQDDIVNCLKSVSSNEEGTIFGYQYQCGSHDKKENGCVSQDSYQPHYDDIDQMREPEKYAEDKDRQEKDGGESAKSGDKAPEVRTFPPNAKISKIVRNGSKSTSRRKLDWSQEVEDKMKRSKRETSDVANQQYMFCYCDEDLCNGSTSLTGTLYLAWLSLVLLHVLSRFH